MFRIPDFENRFPVFSNIFLRFSSDGLFSKTVTISTPNLFAFANCSAISMALFDPIELLTGSKILYFFLNE